MAKSNSPVRLEANLMDAAVLTGSVQHRSAAQQVEYWADLGRKVEGMLTPANVIRVATGVSQIKVSDILGKVIDPDALFQALEIDRVAGKLPQKVLNPSVIRYQKSLSKKGYLDQIHPDGHVVIGRFHNGKFTKIKS